ncbi:hypothetical protein HN587_00865 [Candidatus Woesearchaeota archaeon]|jgi:hypothetical protein|nr:hypothetical protein [Candidatus Woesearchaeota archaeon]
MSLLKILRVECVDGNYNELDMDSHSVPEVYAYGLFSELNTITQTKPTAHLRQESPLFSRLNKLGEYISKTHSDNDDIIAVTNSHGKKYISAEKIIFLNNNQTFAFTAYITNLTYPQYALVKSIYDKIKKE